MCRNVDFTAHVTCTLYFSLSARGDFRKMIVVSEFILFLGVTILSAVVMKYNTDVYMSFYSFRGRCLTSSVFYSLCLSVALIISLCLCICLSVCLSPFFIVSGSPFLSRLDLGVLLEILTTP